MYAINIIKSVYMFVIPKCTYLGTNKIKLSTVLYN